MEELKQSAYRRPRKDEQTLRQSQDIILQSLQQLLPSDFDFQNLAKIFSDGQQSSPSQIVLELIKYFVHCVSNNFVNIKGYQSLEQQTQKLQSTIRSHIKIEQEMKMYLEYLQAKINKYQANMLQSKDQNTNNQTVFELQLLKARETVLMKEKIMMLRENERLCCEIQKKNQEIRQLQKSNKYKPSSTSRPYNIEAQTKRINQASNGKSRFQIENENNNEFNKVISAEGSLENTRQKNHIIPLTYQYSPEKNQQSEKIEQTNKRSFISNSHNNPNQRSYAHYRKQNDEPIDHQSNDQYYLHTGTLNSSQIHKYDLSSHRYRIHDKSHSELSYNKSKNIQLNKQSGVHILKPSPQGIKQNYYPTQQNTEYPYLRINHITQK